MGYPQRSRKHRLAQGLALCALLASPREAVSAQTKVEKLKGEADRLVIGLLEKADPEKTIKAMNKISRKDPEVRNVYYQHMVRVSRDTLEAQAGGPLITGARLLLCGSETCEPAEYVNPKTLEAEVDERLEAHVSGGKVSRPVKLSAPQPHYTNFARMARVQGHVIVMAIVDENGEVSRARVRQGLPLGLAENAVAAVKRWRFTPALLDGEAVPVYYNVTISFSLR